MKERNTMTNYTGRLDAALRKSAWAHEQAGQHRKGGDIPYIIHPFGVMTIASNVTDDEDVLIACLMHDILEDVDSSIYSEVQLRADFGDRVIAIVKDVTKDESLQDWREQSDAYLSHLEHQASDEALVVSACDKIHNMLSILMDYGIHGDELWQRFTTKSADDQLWWYESILTVMKKRSAPEELSLTLENHISSLRTLLGQTHI